MNKYLLCILAFITLSLTATAQDQAPAFPGAEGAARYTTTGGRGGKIIHVTNLNDSGTGSLRAACTASGARIVVFDVSGIIELKSQLKINKDNITILGQTAPGDGICLKNYTFNISASNVIIRFIRCRMGDEKKTEDDAMNSYTHDNNLNNIIIDHCSLSWCTDECGSFYGINNFTLQWCVLSESLRNSIHDKGAHGFGGIWGGKNAIYHHNLLAHHDSRNPRFDHDYVSTLKGPVDFINNVVYNWGSDATYGGESSNSNDEYKMYNMINNYYKPGPASNTGKRFCKPWTACNNCTKTSGVSTVVPGHFYVTGNYMDGYAEVTSDNWIGVQPQNANNETMKAKIKSDKRFIPEGYEGQTLNNLHSAEKAFDKVVSFVGASYKRDVVDQRIAKETQEGNYTYTGSNGSRNGLIDTQGDVGGWPGYEQYGKLTDTDNDGIPDVWETANGLNPNDASDAVTKTLDAKGFYTNIEVYANSLVEDLVKAQNADATDAIAEYYPEAKKAEGVAYYDGSMAKGSYSSTPDTPDPGTEGHGEEFTVSFNGSDSQSTAGFFTFGGSDNKHNFNSKFTGTYDGTEYTQGLKMEGSTLIQFTTTATSTVTIVQSTWSDKTIKFDDSELSVTSATTPEGSSGVREYKIENVSTGDHKITRGSGESGIFAIKVKYSGTSGIVSTYTKDILSTEYYDLQGRRLNSPKEGIMLRVQRMADGRKIASKIIK